MNFQNTDIFEFMYKGKDVPELVQDDFNFVHGFLMFGIYSPTVIREAKKNWEKLPEHVKNCIPNEIEDLIQKSDELSDVLLKEKLNTYAVNKAIRILSGYQNMLFPLTNDKYVKTSRYNLLSQEGEAALRTLKTAKNQKRFTDVTADLATRTSHKFLMDFKYYKIPVITEEMANVLLLYGKSPFAPDVISYAPPILKLSKGCTNNCSHCMNCAEPHISHMPYPLWCGLHHAFYKYYKEPKIGRFTNPFEYFYEDNDPISYYDPIIEADAGDIAFFCRIQGAPFKFTTKGITNEASRKAISKAAAVSTEIVLSFVDTPKENMTHNINQMQETIRLIQSIPTVEKREIEIDHMHLKTGPSVSDEVFLGCPNHKLPIFRIGKAKQFSEQEADTTAPENVGVYPVCIEPNGNIVKYFTVNGLHKGVKVGNLVTGREKASKILEKIEEAKRLYLLPAGTKAEPVRSFTGLSGNPFFQKDLQKASFPDFQPKPQKIVTQNFHPSVHFIQNLR